MALFLRMAVGIPEPYPGAVIGSKRNSIVKVPRHQRGLQQDPEPPAELSA